MKPLTVSQLYNALGKIVANGGKDKTVYVTTDEECNDYRPLWFAPLTDKIEIENVMQSSCSGLNDGVDTANAILLI